MIEPKWNYQALLDRCDAALSRDRRWLIFLFAFTFVLKLIYIIQSADSLQVQVPILDARYYDELARDIQAGHVLRREAFFMGPLYPYWLAFVYSTVGQNVMLVRILQILGGTLTVVLTYLLGMRLFRPSVALIGALLVTLYGTLTFYEGQLLMMWLGTLLNMGVLCLLLLPIGGPKYIKFIAAGVLLGLSALSRANILMFAPFIVIWILLVLKPDRRLIAAGLFIASAVLTISPATIHNYFASRDFVLITSNAGVNFYIGNNEEATGAFYPPKGLDFVTDATTRKHVERLLGRDMKPSEISAYWLDKSFNFIKREPERALRLFVRKAFLFFNGYEIPQIESFDLSKRDYGIFKFLFVNFWFLGTFGLLGVIFTAGRWRHHFLLHWFIITFSLSIILFFITARYRVQIVPVLGLFAAFAAVEVVPKALASARGRFVVPVLIALLLYAARPGIFALDENHILWREHIHQARRLSALGKSNEALTEINQAIERQPNDPESYIHRAIINKSAGKYFQAIEDYTKALKLYPNLPGVHYDLAQTLRGVKMYEVAVEEYLKAIELDSLMIEAYNNVGLTYRDMKDYGRAAGFFRQVIAMDPNYTKAYNNLGACLAESGDFEGAIAILEKAIERDPAYVNSYKNLAMVYIEKKQLHNARHFLEKYATLAPSDEGARQILEQIILVIESDTTGAN